MMNKETKAEMEAHIKANRLPQENYANRFGRLILKWATPHWDKDVLCWKCDNLLMNTDELQEHFKKEYGLK